METQEFMRTLTPENLHERLFEITAEVLPQDATFKDEMRELMAIQAFLKQVAIIVSASSMLLSDEKTKFARAVEGFIGLVADAVPVAGYAGKFREYWRCVEPIMVRAPQTFDVYMGHHWSKISTMFWKAIDASRRVAVLNDHVLDTFKSIIDARRDLAMTVGIVARSNGITNVVLLERKFERLVNMVHKFAKLGHKLSDVEKKTNDSFRAMSDLISDVKTMLILRQLGDRVKRNVCVILGDNVAVESKVDDEMGFTIESSGELLTEFVRFRDSVRGSEEPAALLAAFAENARGMPNLGLTPVIWRLLYSCRQLGLDGVTFASVTESLKQKDAVMDLVGTITRMESIFYSFSGKSVDVDVIRDVMIPVVVNIKEKSEELELDDETARSRLKLDEAVSHVEDIKVCLKIIDETLCVAYIVNEIVADKIGMDGIEPLATHAVFVEMPLLSDKCDDELEHKTAAVPAEYKSLIDVWLTTLKAKQVGGITIGADGFIAIPDLSKVFDIIRKYPDHDLMRVILEGPPTEHDVNKVLRELKRRSIDDAKRHEKTRGAVEILHILHFVFMSMHSCGVLSYSNAWNLSYVRAFSVTGIKQDFLVDCDIRNPLSDDVRICIRDEWGKYAAKLNRGESEAILCDIRECLPSVIKFVCECDDDVQYDELLKWLLLHVWKDIYTEELRDILSKTKELRLDNSEDLGPLVNLLKNYKKVLGSDREYECVVRFMTKHFSGDDGKSTENHNPCQRVLIKLLDICYDDGTVVFDTSVRDELANATSHNISELMKKLHESLSIPWRATLKAMALSLRQLTDLETLSTFDKIARGGFSEDTVVALYVSVKAEVSAIMTRKLSHLLAFVRVRDVMCAGIDDLNFSMLRQMNLTFIDRCSDGLMFLSGVLVVDPVIVRRLSDAYRKLKRLTRQLPITYKPSPELLTEVMGYYADMRLCVDCMECGAQIDEVKNVVDDGRDESLINEFLHFILPMLRTGSIDMVRLKDFSVKVVKSIKSKIVAHFFDSMNIIVMLSQQKRDSDAFLRFWDSNASFVDFVHEAGLFSVATTRDDDENDDLIPMQYGVTPMNGQLVYFGDEMRRGLCTDVLSDPVEKTKLPDDAEKMLIAAFKELRDEREKSTDGTDENILLLQEISEVTREVSRYQVAADRTSALVRDVYNNFVIKQRRFAEEYAVRENKIKATTRECMKKRSELMCRVSSLDKEILTKERRLEQLRRENESLRIAKDRLGLVIGPERNRQVGRTTSVPSVSHATQSKQEIVINEGLMSPDPESSKPVPLSDRFVPKELASIFGPDVYLPIEACEQIERFTAKYKRRAFLSGRETPDSGPQEPEYDSSSVVMSDAKIQYLKGGLADRERRIRNAEMIISEQLSKLRNSE